jgi:predicted SprT family Zn-dependent metalloprotease
MSTPTEQAYTELQQAYDVFNARLFGGSLPPCLITMQRKNRTYGYFSGERWKNVAGAVTDEIAMNPTHFATRSAAEVLSTLAHEMVHLWQHHCGKPPRRAYHDRQWADKMDAIGLAPSDTAAPGGKRTGQHMSHYIREGGPFQRACAELLAQGFAISWRDRAGEGEGGKKKTKSGTRAKYTCPGCGLNAWAKPDVALLCGACLVALAAEEGEDEA